jgi:hypothetical protein
MPAELHANRMQRLTKFCVIRCYEPGMRRPGTHRSVWLRCQVPMQVATLAVGLQDKCC